MNDTATKTILLVEDDAIIAMSETRALQRKGYAVVTAINGAKAVESALTLPRLDLILMDINLGKGISGIQAVLLEDRWKGIRLKKVSAPIELYDLQNDLGEQHNVSTDHPELAARIGQIMSAAHVDNEFWKLPPR